MQKYFTVLFFSLSLVLVVPSCSGGEKKEEKKQEDVKEIYQCPMKCSSEQFDKPGKCPVCGMELEKVTPS